MQEELRLDLLEVLAKHNLLPVTVLRNEKIRTEYRLMQESGIRCKAARAMLAEKYFLSEKNIESILYPRKLTVKKI